MRKWKCVMNKGSNNFKVGKIYTSDDKGYGMTDEDGHEYFKGADVFFNSKFVEVKDFIKSDLQECDVVVLRNGERRVYFDNAFLSKYNADKFVEYYGDNLIRNDVTNEYDVMKVYRNGELIFDRVEKSPRDIKIKELQDKMDEIKREMDELK